jgi:hypothetical protein
MKKKQEKEKTSYNYELDPSVSIAGKYWGGREYL